MNFFAFLCVYHHVFGLRKGLPALPKIQGEALKEIYALRNDQELQSNYESIQKSGPLKRIFGDILKLHPEAFDLLDFNEMPNVPEASSWMTKNMRNFFEEIIGLPKKDKTLLHTTLTKLKGAASYVLQGGQFLSQDRIKVILPYIPQFNQF